jgi:hypothetical protein
MEVARPTTPEAHFWFQANRYLCIAPLLATILKGLG